MSSPTRRLQTVYRDFHFDSDANEAIAKILLADPSIKTEEDLKSFMKFQDKLKLKLCSIPLYGDIVHRDAMDFIEEKRKEQGTHGKPSFYNSHLNWFVKRREYQRQDFIKGVYLVHLNVESLEKISNFQRLCERLMEERNIPENLYDKFAARLLTTFKTKPGVILTHKYLVIDPLYNLITNIMTTEQQDLVAENRNNFYRMTNARKIHKRLANGSSKTAFFEEYHRRDNIDRKMPPYHNLFFIEDEEDSMAAENLSVCVPQEIPMPDSLFVEFDPESDELTFVEFAAGDRNFVAQVKCVLNQRYRKNFNELWVEHRQEILINLIHEHWGRSFDGLAKFFAGSSDDVVARAKALFKKGGDATSSENSSAIQSVPSDVVILSPGTVISIPQDQLLKIKQEKPQASQHLTDNSDIQCLGTMEDAPIELTDSQDSVDELIASLEKDEGQEENPFLKKINQGTQQQANVSFSAFVPLIVQLKQQDRHLKENNENKQK
jgi:hypothetical protein